MLTEITCKNATCAPDKPRTRYADSGGLYLEVAANGSKRWFWKYRFDGKEKRLSIGAYPATKLKEPAWRVTMPSGCTARAQPLAARLQREHQWTGAPVPAQGHRSVGLQPGAARCDCRPDQWSPAQGTGGTITAGGLSGAAPEQPATLHPHSLNTGCCTSDLNPPWLNGCSDSQGQFRSV